MKIPVEAFIIAASLIGASIGYLTCAFFTGAKRQRIERHTWNKARLFYAKLYAEKQ
ncbi:MAG: hypothetical protein U1E02_26635 [Hydrogenophaga sp.]|nr:hypothetical protein [Luteolibacter sp.]MDZ4127715.1 hypothetical protein [Hydrogenophaga sp.]